MNVKRRVAAYIDGLNLYHGMKAAGLDDYRWLDVERLMDELLDPGEEVAHITYFNASAWAIEKRERQADYLAALTAATSVTVVLGAFMEKFWHCSDCRVRNIRHEEKRTDVAIGARLVHDLHTMDFEIAAIVTGDSDVVAAIDVARNVRDVTIRSIFPPKRGSEDLKRVADEFRRMKKKHIEVSLLPDPCFDSDGVAIPCPDLWKPS